MKVYFTDTIDPRQYKRLKDRYELVDNYDHPEEIDGILVRQSYVSGEGAQSVAELAFMMTNIFDVKIYCYNPYATAEELEKLGYERIMDVKELFKICDFVSLHIPLNHVTRNLINKEVFEGADPDLCLINTARGGIVNEK